MTAQERADAIIKWMAVFARICAWLGFAVALTQWHVDVATLSLAILIYLKVDKS